MANSLSDLPPEGNPQVYWQNGPLMVPGPPPAGYNLKGPYALSVFLPMHTPKFPKGWIAPPRTPLPLKQINHTLNEFVIGVGSIIYQCRWINADFPYNWSNDNYFPDSPATFWRLDNQFKAGTHTVMILEISLELTVPLPPRPEYPQNPPRAPPPPTVDAPAPIQLTTFDTYGRNIPYSAGARRLVGAKIWATDIDSGDPNTSQPAIGSWAEAFGYPLFPDEAFFVNRIWGDGQVIYIDPNGPNAGEEVAEGFEELALQMDIYLGTETQVACPTIVADKGANRTPAFRGLIYVVFRNVELVQFGNRIPTISVELLREDQQRILVADVLERVGELGGVNVVCENIDDDADGVVFESFNPRSIVRDYAEHYNYRIIDGDPIRLVRRPVNENLLIDWEFDVDADLLSAGANDEVVTLDRREDSELPNQVDFTFTDKALNYVPETQYARRPRFPVAATQSREIVGQQTDFIITAVEALQLAYDMLYNAWTRRLTVTFKLPPRFSELQEGDVVRLPTPQGTYLFDVTSRSLEANQEVTVEAACLLAESGVEVTADTGDRSRTMAAACWYPQLLFPGYNNEPPLLTADDYLWCPSICEFAGISVVSVRRIPSRISLSAQVPNIPSSPLTTFPTDAVEEGDYIYRVYSYDPTQQYGVTIQRIHKQTKVADTLTIPNVGLPPSGEPAGYRGQFNCAAIFDGVIYFATYGSHHPFIGGTGGQPEISVPVLLHRVPVVPFDGTGASIIELEPAPAVPGHATITCRGIVAVGSNVLVTTTHFGDSEVGPNYVEHHVHQYDTTDGTLASITVTDPLALAVSDGTYAYFMPDTTGLNYYNDPSRLIGARVHGETLAVSYFDVSDDPNVQSVSGFSFTVGTPCRPWLTSDHLCFLANNWIAFLAGIGAPEEETLVYNAPYLARRALTDLSEADGFDLSIHFDFSLYLLANGVANKDKHYLVGRSHHTNIEHGSGCMLRLDLSGYIGTFTPYSRVAPSNDDFDHPITLTPDKVITFYNEFATKEEDEPDHAGDPGGHSLWYSFTPTVSGYYTVAIQGAGASAGTSPASLLAVYEGETLANLVELGSANGVTASHYSVVFPATANTRYHIAVDGAVGRYPGGIYYGSYPWIFQGIIEVTTGGTLDIGNDNFADAFVITTGQIKHGSNAFATKELYEPDHDGNVGGKSVWWKFTAPAANTYRVRTADDRFPMLLAVYTGDSVDDLTAVGASGNEHPSPEDAAAWLTVA